MKICIAGKNSIAINAVKYLREIGIINSSILGLTNRSDIGVNGWQPSFKRFLIDNSIQIIELEDLYKIKDLVFISLEYDQIIKPHLFLSEKLFNVHFSLLPQYKGMYTSAWPILNGEAFTGVTLHLINSGIDTGDIIYQKKFYIKKDDTSFDLYQKYLTNGLILFKQNILSLINNSFSSFTQSEFNSTYYSRKSLDYNNIQIGINQTAFQIKNQIRAFCFRPFQLPKILNRKIYKSEILKSRSEKKAGTILIENDYYVTLSTIDYDICIWYDQLSLLFKSIELNRLKKVRDIVESGFPINEKNNNGLTALAIAIKNNRKEIFEFLLMEGTDYNCKTYDGANLLIHTCEAFIKVEDIFFIKRLLELGLDINQKDYLNKSFLDWAKQKSPKILKKLDIQ